MATRGPKPGSPNAANGGKAVRDKYDSDFFRYIGRKGGRVSAERGPDYYAELGRKGGKTNFERHGREHMAEIGRKGGLAHG